MYQLKLLLAFLVFECLIPNNIKAQSKFYATAQESHAVELKEKFPTQIDIIATNNGEAAIYLSDNVAHELHHKVLVHGPGYIFQPNKESALNSIQQFNGNRELEQNLAIADLYINQQDFVLPLLNQVSPNSIVNHIDELVNYGTRYHTFSQANQAAYDLKSKWEEIATGRNDISVRLVNHGSATAMQSVVLTIEGAEFPDEYVVVGGHLDSINPNNNSYAPGADDNASGIATMTETMRVLIENDYKPKRTVEFMAFAAEEVGLIGSNDIATKYKNQGVNIISFLQLDMTAYNGSYSDIYLTTDYFIDSGLNSFLKDLMNYYNSGGEHEITYSESKCNYGCSDHFSFYKQGYDVAFPIESSFNESNPNIHSSYDVLNYADNTGEHSAKFAKLALEYLVEIAKQNETITPPTCNGSTIEIDIVTDKYAEETSWSLTNQNGQVVLSGDNYSNYQTYSYDYCVLQPECFTFIINDSYGDGICCTEGNGSYTIKVDGEIITSGGEFETTASEEICVNTDSEDTIAPTQPDGLQDSDLTQNSVTLNWNPATDNVGVVGYYIYQNDIKIGNAQTANFSVTNLDANTTYTYRVSAYDESGNESEKSNILTINTLTDVSAEESTFVVNLTTDKYGSETSWVIKNQTGNTVMSGSGYASNTSYTSTENLENGCYTFEIFDTYGDGICCSYGNGSYEILVNNELIASGGSFSSTELVEFCTTSGIEDIEAPSAPTNLSSNVNNSDVTLNWNSSTDNVAVVGYYIYQNNVRVQTVSTNTATIQNLEPSLYEYNVSAYDEAGNESALSNNIEVIISPNSSTGTVVVKISTDNYGEETSWSIKDQNGVIVMNDGNYQSNQSYISTEELESGCYTFEILDTYGDGICCSYGNGSYVIELDGVEQGSGGDFNSSEIVSFCVTSASSKQAEYLVQIYPNPVTTNTINVSTEHIGLGEYTILNSSGVVVQTGIYNGENQSLDLNNLPTGIYIFRIDGTSGKVALNKLFVQ